MSTALTIALFVGVELLLGTALGVALALWVVERATAAADRRWERVVATRHAVETDLVTTAAYGGEKRTDSEPTRELTLEEEAQRHVSEETIQAGMAELRAAYRKVGIEPNEEELRAEVVMVSMGIDPFGSK